LTSSCWTSRSTRNVISRDWTVRSRTYGPKNWTCSHWSNVEGSLREAIERLKHETAGALGPTLLALPALTEVATANAKAINELTAATKANATAIQELGTQLGVVHHDLVVCAALKPIVDEIRYSQLPKIQDNIKKVDTKSLVDFSMVNDDVHWLESKFKDGLDMVNTRVDELLCAQKSPP
jgi:hypothetical protein